MKHWVALLTLFLTPAALYANVSGNDAQRAMRLVGQHGCLSCHGSRAPQFSNIRKSVRTIQTTITDGRTDRGMPSWKNTISSRDITLLANWIADGAPQCRSLAQKGRGWSGTRYLREGSGSSFRLRRDRAFGSVHSIYNSGDRTTYNRFSEGRGNQLYGVKEGSHSMALNFWIAPCGG